MIQTQARRPSKILIIRLSSLGDVVLATAALQSPALQGADVDWVLGREYSSLLHGAPGIRKVWDFERSNGFNGWLKLCRALWEESYDEVLDLHRNLRSFVMRSCFYWWSIRHPSIRRPSWKTYSKSRGRLWGYFFLKKLWPEVLRPLPVIKRVSRTAGGKGSERPDLRFLLKSPFKDAALLPRSYLCVMPGSRWIGKQWGASEFFKVLADLKVFSVVLGTDADQESHRLVALLKESAMPHFSGIGKWTLAESAHVLAGSMGLLSNDTGLVHLAEAVGVPAYVVFGPTAPGMGFGPWGDQSQALGSQLWCRPCGKDGRYCFRVTDRYRCLKNLSSSEVSSRIMKVLK